MQLDEARNIAQQLTGHFRAFARLSEFLEFVAAQEAEAARAQERLAALKQDTAAQEETNAALVRQLTELREALTLAQDALKQSQRAAAEEIKKNKALVEEDLSKRKAAAESEYGTLVAQHADKLTRLTTNIDSAKVELAVLNETIADTKKRIGAL